MYIYSKEQLERMANEINIKYFPERMEKLTKLDPYEFAEFLGLDYEWKYISPNEKILGMIFFHDGMWPVWEHSYFQEGDKPKIEKFKNKTIVINSILLNKNNNKKENFVVMHECCHWIKDKDFFTKDERDIVQICKDVDFDKSNFSNKMSFTEIIERQTNYLAAAILMPEKIVKETFFKSLRWSFVPNTPIEYQKYMKSGIAKIANELGINFNPVLYRLYDLNVLKKSKIN